MDFIDSVAFGKFLNLCKPPGTPQNVVLSSKGGKVCEKFNTVSVTQIRAQTRVEPRARFSFPQLHAASLENPNLLGMASKGCATGYSFHLGRGQGHHSWRI